MPDAPKNNSFSPRPKISSSKNHNPLNELKWFFAIFLIIGLLWFLAGGLNSDKKEDPLITPAGETYGQEEIAKEDFSWKSFFFPWANQGTSTFSGGTGLTAPSLSVPSMSVQSMPVGSISPQGMGVGSIGGGSYNLYDPATERVTDELNNIEYSAPKSDLYGQLTIKKLKAGAKGYDIVGSPNGEYVQIYANKDNTKTVRLTGMTLKSPITLRATKIGQAVKVYYPGQKNTEEDIYLNPGDYAYIYTAKSPIFMSFQLNRCLAYLVNGVPSSCPVPLNYSLPTDANKFSDKCLDYMGEISSCRDYSYGELPTTLEHECRVFIDEHTGYNRCLQDVGSKPGFLGNIWYIYLNRSESLWKSNRDITELRDQSNKLVDIVSR